jgi:hypothetical protein
VRTHAIITTVLALTLSGGGAYAAPAGGCSGTELPHDGMPGAEALLETGPGDFLGRWQDRLLHWHNGALVSITPLPEGLDLVGLAGAAGNGRAVGTIGDPNHAVSVQDGAAAELTMPTGVVTSFATGINKQGDLTFTATDPSHTRPRYFAWAAGSGTPTEILVHSDQFLAMHGIADDRRLLLDWANTDGHTRAATFIAGGATLLALPAGSTDSWSTAVAGSWIIGKAGHATPDRSVAWDATGALHVLPDGFDATAVNRSGLVAGTYRGGAATWSPDGTIRQLPVGSRVFSVADDGTLVGVLGGVPTTWTC